MEVRKINIQKALKVTVPLPQVLQSLLTITLKEVYRKENNKQNLQYKRQRFNEFRKHRPKIILA